MKTTYANIAHAALTLSFEDGSTLTCEGRPNTTTLDTTINRLDWERSAADELPEVKMSAEVSVDWSNVKLIYQVQKLWWRRVGAWLKAFPTS